MLCDQNGGSKHTNTRFPVRVVTEISILVDRGMILDRRQATRVSLRRCWNCAAAAKGGLGPDYARVPGLSIEGKASFTLLKCFPETMADTRQEYHSS